MRTVLFLMLLLPAVATAQISAEETYTGFFAPANPDAPERMNRWMLDIFHDRWEPLPEGIACKWFSGGINIARMMDFPLNQKSNVALAIGLGFGSHNMHYNGYFTESTDSSGAQRYDVLPFNSSYRYSRNKISLNYLEIPFQLRFRSAKKWNFFFYPGFKAGWLFNAHTKTIDDSGKYKLYNFKGFQRLHYGPTLHLGFNRLALFAWYGLSPVLKKNGTAFQSISIGISLNMF